MFNSTTTNMNMKRVKAQDLNYKLQLPEIMQQQHIKMNNLKKQHDARFKNLKNVSSDQFQQTRSRSFNQTFHQDPQHFVGGPQGVIVTGAPFKHARVHNVSPTLQN